MSNAFDHENSIYGAHGEFIPQNMTDDEWRDYDAHVAAELAAFDAQMEAERQQFYWEAEAEVQMAYYDEPDFF